MKPPHKAEVRGGGHLASGRSAFATQKTSPSRSLSHYDIGDLYTFSEEILIFLNKIAHSCHMKNQIDVEPHFSRSFKIRRKGSWSAALRFVP